MWNTSHVNTDILAEDFFTTFFDCHHPSHFQEKCQSFGKSARRSTRCSESFFISALCSIELSKNLKVSVKSISYFVSSHLNREQYIFLQPNTFFHLMMDNWMVSGYLGDLWSLRRPNYPRQQPFQILWVASLSVLSTVSTKSLCKDILLIVNWFSGSCRSHCSPFMFTGDMLIVPK